MSSSLAARLAALADPRPADVDPEDVQTGLDHDRPVDEADDADFGLDDMQDAVVVDPSVRLRADISLSDGAYAGRAVHRAALDSDDDELDVEFEGGRGGSSPDQRSISRRSRSNGVGADSDTALSAGSSDEWSAGSVVGVDAMSSSGSEQDSSDTGIHEDDDDDNGDDDDDSGDESVGSGGDGGARAIDRADQQLVQDLAAIDAEQSAGVSMFSSAKAGNADAESKRAEASRLHRSLWQEVLDARIAMHRVAVDANRLPKPAAAATICASNDAAAAALDACRDAAWSLLSDLQGLQDTITAANPDTVECRVGDVPRDVQGAWALLQRADDTMMPWIRNVMDHWSTKARLSSGKVLRKDLKALNQGAVAQVDSVLQQSDRLVRRSQLKRSAGRALGDPADQAGAEYDEEVFDDTDFFDAQFREYAEARVADVQDPIALGKHFARMAAMRGPKKRRVNVDQRASKGRALRYVVQDKLVNFMAPDTTFYNQDDSVAAQALMASLITAD